MGAVVSDMTLESRLKVETWVRKVPSEDPMVAINLNEAYAKLDWYFLFDFGRPSQLPVRSLQCGPILSRRRMGSVCVVLFKNRTSWSQTPSLPKNLYFWRV